MTTEPTTKTADEIAAQALLDQLVEYSAQADLLALKKAELMDAVKIPDEVQAVHENTQRRKEAIDHELQEQLRAIKEDEQREISAVVVPAELQAQMDAIIQERLQVALNADNKRIIAQHEAERRKSAIDNEFGPQIQKIYGDLAARKSEINAEFDGKASSVKDNIEALTAQIKAAVKKVGKTVKNGVYTAVYVPGRITWNTDRLEGMMALIPQLKEARKVGESSVTLRKA